MQRHPAPCISPSTVTEPAKRGYRALLATRGTFHIPQMGCSGSKPGARVWQLRLSERYGAAICPARSRRSTKLGGVPARQMPGLPPPAAPAACRCRRRSSSYVRKPACLWTLRRACDIRTATRRRRRGSCCRRSASLQAGVARGQRRGQVCPRAAAVQVRMGGRSA